MYLLVEAELHFVLAVHTQQKPTDLYMIAFNFNEYLGLCIFHVQCHVFSHWVLSDKVTGPPALQDWQRRAPGLFQSRSHWPRSSPKRPPPPFLTQCLSHRITKSFLQRCKWRWKETSTTWTWRLYQWKKCRRWPRASSPPPSWSHWPGPPSCRGEIWQPGLHQFQENGYSKKFRSQDDQFFYNLLHNEDSEICVTWEFQPPPSSPLAPDWESAILR